MSSESDSDNVEESSYEQSESDSDSEPDCSEKESLGQKRKINREQWKTNKRKIARNSGKQYINTHGATVSAKKFLLVRGCCKQMCHEAVPGRCQQESFEKFWALADKNEQDNFLLGCMSPFAPKTRVAVPKFKLRTNWTYVLKIDSCTKEVCKKFFLKLFQISYKRIRIIHQKSLQEGNISISDRRGKHENRPHKINSETWDLVKDFLAQIPHKESHYNRSKSKRKYFENPALNVKILFTGFQQYFFKKTKRTLSLKYPTFHRWFRENSEYSFRSPRSDICDFCEENKIKLKLNPNDPCKISQALHERKVQAYKDTKKGIIENSKNDKSTLVIEFDYAQNLPLPKLIVSQQFYKRLLWLYVFNVHCHNDDTSSFYCFTEHEAKKNSNSVISFINHFLEAVISREPNIKNIILFSDAAGGQNKNMNMIHYCLWFAKTQGINIQHIFPVRGHSYCVCDRNFGLYGKLLKRLETIKTPDVYFQIMRQCREKPMAFEVIEGATLIKDWDKGLKGFFKQSTKSKAMNFTLRQYCRLKYTSSGTLCAAQSFTGFFAPFDFWITKKKDNLEVHLETVPPNCINPAKMQNIKDLMKYLERDESEWYEKNVFKVPENLTPTEENNGENSDISDLDY